MRTLEKWVDRLLDVPNTIECPVMQILGRDFEPPIFTGSGYILIRSKTEMGFVMHATPGNSSDAFSRMVRAQKNPDSINDQVRLVVTEYDGTEWNCGWVSLRIGSAPKSVWRLSGAIKSMWASVSGSDVSSASSVELVYDTKLRIPTQMNMVTSVQLDNKEVLWSRRMGNQIIEVADTKIEFSHAVKGDIVWATANTSTELCHPYAENWISEPLQILLGQLAFPRLVARNRGDGSAMISLRRSPVHGAHAPLSSLLSGDSWSDPGRFWQLYCDILTMVVHARDDSGNPNFEANPLTHYYHEIAQATSGSLWVLCMTLAGAIEGIAGLLTPPAARRLEIEPEMITDLKKHIKDWTGDKSLRDRVLSSVARIQETGAIQWLKALCRDGAIENEQVYTWQSVRNQVMHGNLVSPWLDKELKEKIVILSGLAHRLSAEYIRKCVTHAD